MNAVKTELTVSLPYDGGHVGVKVDIDWTMEDGYPYIHLVNMIDQPDDLAITTEELNKIALEYLETRQVYEGEQNEITEADMDGK